MWVDSGSELVNEINYLLSVNESQISLDIRELIERGV